MRLSLLCSHTRAGAPHLCMFVKHRYLSGVCQMSIERQLKPFQQSTPKSCRMYGLGSAYATRLADKVLVAPATHIFRIQAAAIQHATQGLAHKAVRTGAQFVPGNRFLPMKRIVSQANVQPCFRGRTGWPSALQLQTRRCPNSQAHS